MTYTIIEDCSPYYIRFTHEGIDSVVKKCLRHVKKIDFADPFTHHVYNFKQSLDILSSVPLREILSLNQFRVSLFVTQPGVYYGAHKDGTNHRYSLNYTVKILDDKCVTSWYSDESLKDYHVVGIADSTVKSRECQNFDKLKHTPLKSMTAIQGECILFNTDIFHDFDNSLSSNERMVLTLRDSDPGNVYFEDAKRKIFGVNADVAQ